ncbi:MAG: prolyl oligopeptidase family serine peptidase [Gammaproteobacteria bacterium]
MLLLVVAAPQALAQTKINIPAAAFFQHAQFRNVKISPDGKYLAVIGPIKGHEEQSQVDIVAIATASVYAHYSLGEFLPVGIWWANNSQLLFTTAHQYGWYDHPVSTGYVWAMNIKSGNVDSIAYPNDVYRVLYRNQGRTGYVELGGGEFLEFDQDAKYAGDNKNARATHLLSCPGTPISAPPSAEELTDRAGGYVYDDNAGYTRLWLGYNQLTYVPEMAYAIPCDPQSRWYNMSDFLATQPRYTAYGPWMFTADNRAFYYAGLTPAGTTGLFLVNPRTWNKILLYADPGYDIDNLFNAKNAWLVSDDGLSLLAFEYMADRPVWVLIDKSAPEAKLLEDLQKKFDGQNVMITSRTVDGSLSILFVSSDQNPGDYYLYEAKSGKTIHLFKVLPGIDPDAMAPMQPIQFKARDGMTIHGYLTLPRGQGQQLPLIVLPHGGPFGIRDNWGFDPEVQFFAYHGYAVLQIEFRGSGGYGYAYQKAGYRQWGGAMQDDVTDGTHWAIQQGIADPKRICIYGASYGGYAAIEGAVKEPDLYQCAVGYAGVYDLVSFRSHFHTLHYQYEIPAITTELGDDEDYLKAHSPVFHVDQIKAALFLAHGGEDKTVPEEQADELRDALDKIYKPYEWLYYRNEGHGFYTLDHKVELYTKMLAFFDKSIGQPSATH